MNTYQFMTQATGGFLTGVLAARTRNQVDDAAMNLELAKVYADSSKLDEMKKSGIEEKLKTCRRLTNTVPACFGYLFSFLSSQLSTGNYHLGENLLVSLPAAYLGYLTGTLIHSHKRKPLVRDIKTAKQMKEHPEQLESLLEPEQRQRITENLNQLEQAIIDHGVQAGIAYAPQLFVASTIPMRAYSKLVEDWTLEQVNKRTEFGAKAHDFKLFYESPLPDPNAVACAIFGQIKGSDAIVYYRQGDELQVRELKLENPRLLERDGSPIIAASSKSVLLTDVRKEPWTGDYRTLARSLTGTEQLVLLLRSNEQIPDGAQKMFLTQTYFDGLIAQSKRERDQKAEGGRK